MSGHVDMLFWSLGHEGHYDGITIVFSSSYGGDKIFKTSVRA
jgi:hypothetical protein